MILHPSIHHRFTTGSAITLVLLALHAILAGCGRVNEITVSPPQSPDRSASQPPTIRGSIAVELRTRGDTLPPYLHSTRFRVSEIRFRSEQGEWIRRLSDRTAYFAESAPRSAHTLLRTELPDARYDSLSLFLSDVFVRFSETAGGPLTIGRNPVTIPVDLRPVSTRNQTLVLLYDPGASVHLDSTASTAFPQWRFAPVFAVPSDTAAGEPK